MSDERDDAAYYEAHKDDDDWGEPEAPKARRRLASMFSVRLAPAEAEVIREAAEREGLSVSAFMRNAALALAQGVLDPAPAPRQLSANSFDLVSHQVTILTLPVGASDVELLGDTSAIPSNA